MKDRYFAAQYQIYIQQYNMGRVYKVQTKPIFFTILTGYHLYINRENPNLLKLLSLLHTIVFIPDELKSSHGEVLQRARQSHQM